MSIGVHLTDKDLQAIKKLYGVRWSAEIRNWKERDTDCCLWLITCPNLNGTFVTETGHSLSDTIEELLNKM